jgi:uncharacterized metal-binding protein
VLRLVDGFLRSHYYFCGVAMQTKDSVRVVNQAFVGIDVICEVGHRAASIVAIDGCRARRAQRTLRRRQMKLALSFAVFADCLACRRIDEMH